MKSLDPDIYIDYLRMASESFDAPAPAFESRRYDDAPAPLAEDDFDLGLSDEDMKGTVLAHGPTEEVFTRANLERAFGGVLRHIVLDPAVDGGKIDIISDDENASSSARFRRVMRSLRQARQCVRRRA